MEGDGRIPALDLQLPRRFLPGHTVKDREQSVREAAQTWETFVSEV